MYIKKADRETINNITKNANTNGLPKHFYEWIHDQITYLGLKKQDKCYCIACKNEFSTKVKINEFDTCPNCNRKILIKRFDIKWFERKHWLNILQPYKDNLTTGYLARNFCIEQWYKDKKINYRIIEFGRLIIHEDCSLGFGCIINTMIRNLMGIYYFSRGNDYDYWKPDGFAATFYGKFYPYNLDDLLKPKYVKIKDFIENINEINICELIYGINNNDYSLEKLIKAKLYNLAVNYGDYRGDSFEKVFSLNKSYLPIMQQMNVNVRELEVMQTLKIKDIDQIRYFSKIDYFDMRELLKFCKLNDLYEYKLNQNCITEYLDYLRFAKRLGYNMKDKRILYPKHKQLKSKHDELMRLIEVNNNKRIQKKIHKRCLQLQKNIFQNEKYIIFPANSIEEMINESTQQNNCVKTYTEKYANGDSDIYFMRLVSDYEKSLVTVEVIENKIVQQRIKNNMDTTKEQKMFLRLWERSVLNKL